MSKSAKSAKAKSNKASKASKPRQPLTEAEVRDILENHPAGPKIKAFRKGTEEGRSIVRTHPVSGKTPAEAAKFIAELRKETDLSFRQIEAVMGLAHHNGMTAFRLVARGKRLNTAEKRAASKAAKTPATAAVEPAPAPAPAPVAVAEATPAPVEAAQEPALVS